MAMHPNEPYPRLTKAFTDMARAALAARDALVEHPDYENRPVTCEKAEMDAKYPMPDRWREHANDWRVGYMDGLRGDNFEEPENDSELDLPNYAYASGYRAGWAEYIADSKRPNANLTQRELLARRAGFEDAEAGEPCAGYFPTGAENAAYREGYMMGKPAWKA